MISDFPQQAAKAPHDRHDAILIVNVLLALYFMASQGMAIWLWDILVFSREQKAPFGGFFS